MGNVTGEIVYTQKSPTNRWQFPSYYYTKTFSIPNTTYTLEIIQLDTVILCGASVDTLEYCTRHNLIPNSYNCSLTPIGPNNIKGAQDEWRWLNQTLSSSTADFVIVSGHYPVWSIAEHGPTALLVDKLRPLLWEYGVQLYMNGHDHTMEYIEEVDHSSVGYVTTGAAHVCDGSTSHIHDVPKGSLLYHDCNNGGFVRVKIDNDGMIVYYYLSDSTDVTYTTKTFPPRSSQFTIAKKEKR